jgi:hypothetical protein
MQTLTQQVVDAGLSDRVLTKFQLGRLIEGSSQRRYNLVNRAMKAGELIRLRRGLYMLPDKYRRQPCHPFALAQALVPGSYVSLETALSFHKWIPEAVYTTASIVPGRKAKEINHDQLGLFTFNPLALHTGYFLELVNRVQLDDQPVLIASPIRALLDLVCFRKLEWQGLSWIEQGMRIDKESLKIVTGADLGILKQVYKHKQVTHFLSELEVALGLEPGHD